MKNKNYDLVVLSAGVAFCGMLYELILAQSLAAVWGSTLERYQVVIGVYLTSMGAGAYLASRLGTRVTAWQGLWIVELVLAIAGGLTPLLCVSLPWISGPWIVVIGMLGGAELPLLMEIAETRTGGCRATARILAADYLGMLAAGAIFVSWCLPRLGLFGTGWLAGALNACAAIATLGWAGRPVRKTLPTWKVVFAVSIAATVGQTWALLHANKLQTAIIEHEYLR